MSKIEEALRAAAEETTRLARTKQPPGLDRGKAPTAGRAPRRASLAFVGTFVAVVITFALVPWLANTTPAPPLGDTQPQLPTTSDSSSIDTAPAPTTCSAHGAPIPGPDPGLPDAVAAVRDEIASAASDCDLAALEAIGGERLQTSFGGGGVENLRSWEEEGQGQLDTLVHILGMTHGVVEFGDGDTILVWPAAFSHESWDDIPDDELAELSAIYTAQELDQLAGFGSYAGWRTGIDQEGNWLFFVAGD